MSYIKLFNKERQKRKVIQMTNTTNTMNVKEYEPIKDYWTDGEHYDIYCGNCNGSLGENKIHPAWDYCPYCGAKIKK